MSRRTSLLALAAAVAGICATRARRTSSGTGGGSTLAWWPGRRDRLPRGVETYRAPVVDRRSTTTAVSAPAVTPAEIAEDYYRPAPS